MNKLNTIIIILLSFVLLSPVFTTISYAEYTEIPVTIVDARYSSSSATESIAGYTIAQIHGLANSTDIEARNTMLEAVSNANYYVFWLPVNLASDRWVTYVYEKNASVDIGVLDTSTKLSANVWVDVGSEVFTMSYTLTAPKKYTVTTSGRLPYFTNYTTLADLSTYLESDPNFLGTVPYIKELVSNNGYYWNGEYVYYRETSIGDPDTPIFPTNAEIASAVQKFYNSDIYKNNTNFKDFIVVYSSLKNTYAFIGTDNHMLQEIFYDGVKVPGLNFSSSDTWWRFNSKFGDIQSFLFGSKFYLYFIEGNSDLITNEGTGTLYDLFDLKFTTGMTIVYSTYDYDVIEYRPPLEGETDNQVTSGTIQGDSYTYDENLDSTDSQYSPLQNYVSSDPTQSILNDVDFDSINQAFEDGKVILNIENASWIFTANNQLVEYFLGFISFLIVLVAISRVLGG